MSMGDIYAALEECGIPWDEPDFAPGKPPEPPYACVCDDQRFDGSDFHVGLDLHGVTVRLYANKRSEARQALSHALARRNVKHFMAEQAYDYETKLFETEYEIDDFYEKWEDER